MHVTKLINVRQLSQMLPVTVRVQIYMLKMLY